VKKDDLKKDESRSGNATAAVSPPATTGKVGLFACLFLNVFFCFAFFTIIARLFRRCQRRKSQRKKT
jgi:hypothetical protein